MPSLDHQVVVNAVVEQHPGTVVERLPRTAEAAAVHHGIVVAGPGADRDQGDADGHGLGLAAIGRGTSNQRRSASATASCAGSMKAAWGAGALTACISSSIRSRARSRVANCRMFSRAEGSGALMR